MVKCKSFDYFAAPVTLHPLHSFAPTSISSDFSAATVAAIVADAERACEEAADFGPSILHDEIDAGPRILTDQA